MFLTTAIAAFSRNAGRLFAFQQPGIGALNTSRVERELFAWFSESVAHDHHPWVTSLMPRGPDHPV